MIRGVVLDYVLSLLNGNIAVMYRDLREY